MIVDLRLTGISQNASFTDGTYDNYLVFNEGDLALPVPEETVQTILEYVAAVNAQMEQMKSDMTDRATAPDDLSAPSFPLSDDSYSPEEFGGDEEDGGDEDEDSDEEDGVNQV